MKYLIGLLTLFLISSVFLTIETATIGSENTFLENKQKELIQDRKDLEQNLVKSISMTKLEEQSLAAGFVKPTNYLYINSDEQVASLR